MKQGNINESLFAAEKGRAQALIDLMEYSFYDGVGPSEEGNNDLAVLKNPAEEEDELLELLSYLPLNTVFQAVDYPDVSLWVILQGKQIHFKQSNVERTVSENGGPSHSFKAVILNAYAAIGVNKKYSMRGSIFECCERKPLKRERED